MIRSKALLSLGKQVDRKPTNGKRKVYFSGIQPTGEPHLGNYLGFIKNWVKIQNAEPSETKLYLSVVDLHAITTKYVPAKEMSDGILKMTAGLIACGVDPVKTVLFKQSDVLEHTQLSWILSSLQTIAKLQRQPQFKDKSLKYKNGEVPVGLLSYPVLQSADVLLYKATHVPVGEDQQQHINLMVDLATKFNLTTGTSTLQIPQAVITKQARVKSLRDPGKKMSKSDPQPLSRISIYDSEAEIGKKIQKAVTDGIREISYEPRQRPGVSNLLEMLGEFENVSSELLVQNFQGKDTVALKKHLAHTINQELKDVRRQYSDLVKNPEEISKILKQNGEIARSEAANTIREVKEIIGLSW
uniref:Tryptophan--tRNA ligase n=1 Tax=Rhabditophanes sp. KR3021 TaxID=114890 RepID=A0AC35UF81_9BILA